MLPGLWETPSIKIKKGEKPEISLIIGIQKKLGIPLKNKLSDILPQSPKIPKSSEREFLLYELETVYSQI